MINQNIAMYCTIEDLLSSLEHQEDCYIQMSMSTITLTG